MDPFLAEIRIFPFNFAPRGWATCDGQILPISQNTALFALLGTTYGGDGRINFALPNLQGSAPLHSGQGPGLSQYTLGETAGASTVTLLQSEMPAHTHLAKASSAAGEVDTPGGAAWAKAGVTRGQAIYQPSAPATNVLMNPAALSLTGDNQPHENMPPYLVLNFCIALQGIFPARG